MSDIQCDLLPKPTSITETCNNDNPCKGNVIAYISCVRGKTIYNSYTGTDLSISLIL